MPCIACWWKPVMKACNISCIVFFFRKVKNMWNTKKSATLFQRYTLVISSLCFNWRRTNNSSAFKIFKRLKNFAWCSVFQSEHAPAKHLSVISEKTHVKPFIDCEPILSTNLRFACEGRLLIEKRSFENWYFHSYSACPKTCIFSVC